MLQDERCKLNELIELTTRQAQELSALQQRIEVLETALRPKGIEQDGEEGVSVMDEAQSSICFSAVPATSSSPEGALAEFSFGERDHCLQASSTVQASLESSEAAVSSVSAIEERIRALEDTQFHFRSLEGIVSELLYGTNYGASEIDSLAIGIEDGQVALSRSHYCEDYSNRCDDLCDKAKEQRNYLDTLLQRLHRDHPDLTTS